MHKFIKLIPKKGFLKRVLDKFKTVYVSADHAFTGEDYSGYVFYRKLKNGGVEIIDTMSIPNVSPHFVMPILRYWDLKTKARELVNRNSV